MPTFNFWHKPKEQVKHQLDQPPADNISGPYANLQAVFPALHAYVSTKDYVDKVAVLKRDQAQLLTYTADQLLTIMFRQMQQSNDPGMKDQAGHLMLDLALLREARTRGISAVETLVETVSAGGVGKVTLDNYTIVLNAH